MHTYKQYLRTYVRVDAWSIPLTLNFCVPWPRITEPAPDQIPAGGRELAVSYRKNRKNFG